MQIMPLDTHHHRPRRPYRITALWCLILLLLTPAWVTALPAITSKQPDYRHERQLYKEARRALKEGKTDTFRRLQKKLADYPLYPYLVYYDLRKHLDTARHDAVKAFLQDYGDTPLAGRLRRAWLLKLAGREDWKKFLDVYVDGYSTDIRCYALRAQLSTGKSARKVTEGSLAIWLAGHSQPKSCDPLFSRLESKNLITRDMRWQRIELAMQENNPSLAKYLAKKLPARDRHWANLWQSVHRQPASGLKHKDLKQDTRTTRKIILHGLRRLARSRPDSAWAHWQDTRGTHQFSATERSELERYIGLRAAYKKLPEAHLWLAQVPAKHHTETSREWRARSALVSNDWDATIDAIDAMPRAQRNTEEWKFWKARALRELKQGQASESLLRRLADERSYFGFLAADELDQPYRMVHAPIEPDAKLIDEIAALPGIQRAHELFRLDEKLDARREWYRVTRDMDQHRLRQAAVLANHWDWHDRAIITVSKAGHLDDLSLRFPVPYKRHTLKTARDMRLDPSWIFGIMRQESAFMSDARSHAGAMGLMQLMPSTGKRTARALKIPLRRTGQLLQPEKNIRIGSGYLQQMLNRFDGNIVLATAAYNAGPHRVDRWLPEQGSMDAALWAESIPYTETRKYVRAVMAFTAVFDWRLDDKVTRLSRRMQPVNNK